MAWKLKSTIALHLVITNQRILYSIRRLPRIYKTLTNYYGNKRYHFMFGLFDRTFNSEILTQYNIGITY